MHSGRSSMSVNSFNRFVITLVVAILFQVPWAASVIAPSSNCYALDNSSHLFDFVSYYFVCFKIFRECVMPWVAPPFSKLQTRDLLNLVRLFEWLVTFTSVYIGATYMLLTSWIGHPFEYDGKDSDLVVRFCRDVESRSQTVFPNHHSQLGYVDFGRFDTSSYFMAGSGHVSFVQGFYNGDLTNCEESFDKKGRTAQVDILCGNCLNGRCKGFDPRSMLSSAMDFTTKARGAPGCICNVTYDSTCRVHVELAIPCGKRGPRVFEGFTVGFHPRSWELVYNGMTQLGFEKPNREFRFGTEQTHVSLYMTAISAFSSLVGKPVIKVSPDKGLEVELSGSGANGSPPTTLSPTILIIDWRCEKASETPYQVDISIPVEGYESVEFTLTKMCEHRQNRRGDATRGWATFGILSCIFIVMLTLLCCGGFIYKTRVEHQHGLDALPGMTILSACLETVSGGSGSYSRTEDLNGTFINQASWERQPVSGQGNQRTSERRYGSI